MAVKGRGQEPPFQVLGIVVRPRSLSGPGLKCSFLEVAEQFEDLEQRARASCSPGQTSPASFLRTAWGLLSPEAS